MSISSLTNPKKIGVAIAGLGFGTKVHMPAICSNPDFKLIGFYHPNVNKLNAISDNKGLLLYSNWIDLLNNKSIEAIIIATPPEPRFELAKQALEAGKHLLLEKPVALSSDQIKTLQKLAIRNRLSVAVNFEYRFVPLFIQAQRILKENSIGDPWLVKFDWLMSSRADKERKWNWYSDKDQGGGVIGALGTHAIDVLHWFVGPSVSVSSLLSTSIKSRLNDLSNQQQLVTSEDNCFAHIELLNDKSNSNIPCQLSLSAVSINGRGCWIEIYGSNGKLLLGSDNQKDYVHGFGLWVSRKGERPVAINPNEEINFTRVWEDGRIAPVAQLQKAWAGSIISGRPMVPGLSEAFNSQKVCDSLKESSKSEMTVSNI